MPHTTEPRTTENITVRMPPEQQEKLTAIAAELDRSRNWVINQAIENYLDVYAWQSAKIRERLKEAHKGGKFVSGSEISKLVESFRP